MPLCSVSDACVAQYEASVEWQALSPVFEADWQRRPSCTDVRYHDGRWIVVRLAVLARYFGYVQGYLYLLLPLQHVLKQRDLALHALLVVVGATHCYSPIGLELGFYKHRRAVVDEVLHRATQRYPQARARLVHISSSEAFYDNVCLRLLFIVFGQTFEFDALLTVWDYVLPSLFIGNHNPLIDVACELLAHYAITSPRQCDANEDADAIWGVRAAPMGNEVAAKLVARCISAQTHNP
jgi:hypothetical protein